MKDDAFGDQSAIRTDRRAIGIDDGLSGLQIRLRRCGSSGCLIRLRLESLAGRDVCFLCIDVGGLLFLRRWLLDMAAGIDMKDRPAPSSRPDQS